MEVVQGRRVCGSMSPERGKVCSVQTRNLSRTMFKKVQVVYYLSRNGHLEHPHYMEVTHLAHQQLRLKDVMDRLRNLRGKAMPSLYSWSCKRSYKNGYVWNDLSENDTIYPSEGVEYVLKGSELIDGCTEKLHQIQIGNSNHQQDENLQQYRRRGVVLRKRSGGDEMVSNQYDDQENDAMEEVEDEYDEKMQYPGGAMMGSQFSRCSRGVSTDEIQEFGNQEKGVVINQASESLPLDGNLFSSPPSTTTTSSSASDIISNNNNNGSKRFEDGTVGNEPLLSRNSMLLSLIACGGSTSFRKTVLPPVVKQLQLPTPPPTSAAARKSNAGSGDGNSMHKGVICKAAAKVAVESEEEMMIGCMSENPRFGNFQAEEKEYFSGSIVESIGNERRAELEPRLKKSSSHKEERSAMAGLGEAAEEEVNDDRGMKGKCIPRKKSSSSKQSKK